MKYLFILFSLFLTACATHELTPSGKAIQTDRDYTPIIEKNTDRVRRYSGFYNTLDIEGTVLNSQVLSAQAHQNALLYQWDDNKLSQELNNVQTRMTKEAEIFLSFFTPDRKNDDLYKTTTIWKIFLDVDGKRYEGKAKKIRLPLAELEGLYPYYNRFYTPYSVTFPVTMQSIENRPLSVTITGTVGSGTMTFSP